MSFRQLEAAHDTCSWQNMFQSAFHAHMSAVSLVISVLVVSISVDSKYTLALRANPGVQEYIFIYFYLFLFVIPLLTILLA